MLKGTKGQSKEVVRYSESFKLQVIRELEDGVHLSYKGACDAYGIASIATVSRWHEKYGNQFKKRKFMRVEGEDDRKKSDAKDARIRELERALSTATIDLLLEREFLKIWCERAGDGDVEAFKKNTLGECTPGQGIHPWEGRSEHQPDMFASGDDASELLCAAAGAPAARAGAHHQLAAQSAGVHEPGEGS